MKESYSFVSHPSILDAEYPVSRWMKILNKIFRLYWLVPKDIKIIQVWGYRTALIEKGGNTLQGSFRRGYIFMHNLPDGEIGHLRGVNIEA